MALTGRRIWVTRPAQQAESLCALIAADGAVPVRIPVVEIAPVADRDAVRAALAIRVDLLVFISRNAVRCALDAMPDLLSRCGARIVIAVGEGTRRELADAGIEARAAPDAGSEALLAMPELCREQVFGRRVLIVRGPAGRPLLARELGQRGAAVHEAGVYTRAVPGSAVPGPAQVWKIGRPDVIVVTSNEGFDNLMAMSDPELHPALLKTPLAVISPRTAEHARAAGHAGRIAVAPGATDAGLMEAIRIAGGTPE